MRAWKGLEVTVSHDLATSLSCSWKPCRLPWPRGVGYLGAIQASDRVGWAKGLQKQGRWLTRQPEEAVLWPLLLKRASKTQGSWAGAWDFVLLGAGGHLRLCPFSGVGAPGDFVPSRELGHLRLVPSLRSWRPLWS